MKWLQKEQEEEGEEREGGGEENEENWENKPLYFLNTINLGGEALG